MLRKCELLTQDQKRQLNFEIKSTFSLSWRNFVVKLLFIFSNYKYLYISAFLLKPCQVKPWFNLFTLKIIPWILVQIDFFH